MLQLQRRDDGQVGRQRSACTRSSAEHGRDALIMFFAGAHYRQPMAFDEERWRRRARGSRASATPCAGWSTASRRPTCACTATRSSPRSPRTSTPRRRSARCSSGSARQPPLRAGRARGPRARCSPCSALENLAEAADEAGAGGARAARRRQAAPRREGLRRGRPAARRARRARLDGSRRRRRGRARARRAVILYGRNAVHEALRAGRRRIGRVWATERAAREPWLRDVGDLQSSSAAEIERRCDSPDHQGMCAEAGGYPVRRRGGAAGASPIRSSSRSTSCRTRRTSARSPHRRVRRRDRRGHLRTPGGRGHAGGGKASAGAVEHLRIARVRNLADFLAAAKEAGCWCYGADGESPRATTSRTTAAGSCSCSEARAAGCARASPPPAMPDLAAAARRVQSLNASAAAAVLMYEIVQRRTIS